MLGLKAVEFKDFLKKIIQTGEGNVRHLGKECPSKKKTSYRGIQVS